MNQGQQPHVFGCQPCIQSLLGKGSIRKMTETEEKNEMTYLSPSDKKKDTEFQVQKGKLIPVTLGLCFRERSSHAHV